MVGGDCGTFDGDGVLVVLVNCVGWMACCTSVVLLNGGTSLISVTGNDSMKLILVCSVIEISIKIWVNFCGYTSGMDPIN